MGRYWRKKIIIFLGITVFGYLLWIMLNHFDGISTFAQLYFSWLFEDSIYFLGFVFGGLVLFIVSSIFDFYIRKKNLEKNKDIKKTKNFHQKM